MICPFLITTMSVFRIHVYIALPIIRTNDLVELLSILQSVRVVEYGNNRCLARTFFKQNLEEPIQGSPVN